MRRWMKLVKICVNGRLPNDSHGLGDTELAPSAAAALYSSSRKLAISRKMAAYRRLRIGYRIRKRCASPLLLGPTLLALVVYSLSLLVMVESLSHFCLSWLYTTLTRLRHESRQQ